jgi:hypothetical protein
MNSVQDAPFGLLSFLSFAFSIIAAVSAIDMYKLLRTGEFGKSWRLLIIASVMLALLQVLRMAEILNFRPVAEAHLAQIVELCFVMSLAYAFYVQRKLFSYEHKRSTSEDAKDEESDGNEFPEDETGHTSFEEYVDEEYVDHNLSPHQKPGDTTGPVSAPSKVWTQHGSGDISRPAP